MVFVWDGMTAILAYRDALIDGAIPATAFRLCSASVATRVYCLLLHPWHCAVTHCMPTHTLPLARSLVAWLAAFCLRGAAYLTSGAGRAAGRPCLPQSGRPLPLSTGTACHLWRADLPAWAWTYTFMRANIARADGVAEGRGRTGALAARCFYAPLLPHLRAWHATHAAAATTRHKNHCRSVVGYGRRQAWT